MQGHQLAPRGTSLAQAACDEQIEVEALPFVDVEPPWQQVMRGA